MSRWMDRRGELVVGSFSMSAKLFASSLGDSRRLMKLCRRGSGRSAYLLVVLLPPAQTQSKEINWLSRPGWIGGLVDEWGKYINSSSKQHAGGCALLWIC